MVECSPFGNASSAMPTPPRLATLSTTAKTTPHTGRSIHLPPHALSSAGVRLGGGFLLAMSPPSPLCFFVSEAASPPRPSVPARSLVYGGPTSSIRCSSWLVGSRSRSAGPPAVRTAAFCAGRRGSRTGVSPIRGGGPGFVTQAYCQPRRAALLDSTLGGGDTAVPPTAEARSAVVTQPCHQPTGRGDRWQHGRATNRRVGPRARLKPNKPGRAP